MFRFKITLFALPILLSCNATGSSVIKNDWPTDCLDKSTLFQDNDGDGFGDSAISMTSCVTVEGYVEESGDCNDDDPNKNPDAMEICDAIDNNCSGVIDDEEACPCQVESKEDGGDYLFCGASVTWNEAYEQCETYQRRLVVIDSEDENMMLTSILDTRLPGIWWIGMSDRDNEGEWTWIDGSPVNVDAWHEGEPNDYGGEDCGEIYRWGIETWNDSPCDTNNNFICESVD